MVKNIEKLAKLGEDMLYENSITLITDINVIINELGKYNPNEKENSLQWRLIQKRNEYNDITREANEEYGLVFAELQKKYNELLPKINKLLYANEEIKG